MRALVQRVHKASVEVEGEIVGQIGKGLLVFLGVTHDDDLQAVEFLSRKVAGLRVFEDAEGKMNRSLKDIGGECLVVSQFTLYGNCHKGFRPSFNQAARPEQAAPLIDDFVARIKDEGIPVATGRFAAMMNVRLENDGPVTLFIESREGV